MKLTKILNRYLLAMVAVLLLAGLILAACGSQEPAPAETEPEVAEAVWNVPAAFAEDTFPVPISNIEEHENPWQIRDCFTCHDEQAGDATEIPHDIYTQSCRQCHVPADGAGTEY